eukprot:3941983-Rhodomonas_salina.2
MSRCRKGSARDVLHSNVNRPFFKSSASASQQTSGSSGDLALANMLDSSCCRGLETSSQSTAVMLTRRIPFDSLAIGDAGWPGGVNSQDREPGTSSPPASCRSSRACPSILYPPTRSQSLQLRPKDAGNAGCRQQQEIRVVYTQLAYVADSALVVRGQSAPRTCAFFADRHGEESETGGCKKNAEKDTENVKMHERRFCEKLDHHLEKMKVAQNVPSDHSSLKLAVQILFVHNCSDISAEENAKCKESDAITKLGGELRA